MFHNISRLNLNYGIINMENSDVVSGPHVVHLNESCME